MSFGVNNCVVLAWHCLGEREKKEKAKPNVEVVSTDLEDIHKKKRRMKKKTLFLALTMERTTA